MQVLKKFQYPTYTILLTFKIRYRFGTYTENKQDIYYQVTYHKDGGERRPSLWGQTIYKKIAHIHQIKR